jgi:LysR family glycine cleavage system transcriptional activator
MVQMRLPPLTALRAFEAVGRLGDIRQAASELNVTAAAISHQIRALEGHLRVELFLRGSHGLALTRRGQSYLTEISEAFEQLDRASHQISRREDGGRLVIAALSSFGTSVLAPRIHKFHALEPNVETEISILQHFGQGQVLDLDKIGVDVAISATTCDPTWPGLIAEKLIHEELFPVCAPFLLEGPNALRTPQDLCKHTILIATHAVVGWREWLETAREKGLDVHGVDPDRGLRFDTIQMSMTAASKGAGVDMGRRPFVDPLIESGALVPLFGVTMKSKLSYWLVYPEAVSAMRAFQAFRTWLFQELDTDPLQASGCSRQRQPARKRQALAQSPER